MAWLPHFVMAQSLVATQNLGVPPDSRGVDCVSRAAKEG